MQLGARIDHEALNVAGFDALADQPGRAVGIQVMRRHDEELDQAALLHGREVHAESARLLAQLDGTFQKPGEEAGLTAAGAFKEKV